MSYETAPATAMLATHCGICGRPLVDAQSVETGIGPVCREKYMVADKVTEAARAEGNKLIYRIAQLQRGKEVDQAILRLTELGFAKLVGRIQKRLRKRSAVRISYQGSRLVLNTRSVGEDMWDSYLSALRAIPGRRYEGKGVGNSFPMDQKRSVLALLVKFFPGCEAVGPKGTFTIGQA